MPGLVRYLKQTLFTTTVRPSKYADCLGAIKDWPGVTWPGHEQLSDEAAGVHQSVLAYLCRLLSCGRLFALQLRLRNNLLQTLRYPGNHPFAKEETCINNCERDFTGH